MKVVVFQCSGLHCQLERAAVGTIKLFYVYFNAIIVLFCIGQTEKCKQFTQEQI